MRIIFLGTSASLPTTQRGLSCMCLERDGEILMFDAGEGTQIAYLRSGLGWNKPMKIFVTHLHGDHCIGILGLLQSMSLKKRSRSLEVYGPPGIEEFLAANIQILGFGISFPLAISSVSEGLAADGESYTVSAARAAHSIEAYSYLFEEKPRPGRFYRDKAVALGIPQGEAWGRLQSGEEIVVDGRTIKPGDVLGSPRRGKKIGVSGDTRPAAHLSEFFHGCDYLIFDSTFAEDMKARALETFHSTAREAATLARDARVTNLILTHFSARYGNTQTLVDEAAKIHDSVIAAKDLLMVDV